MKRIFLLPAAAGFSLLAACSSPSVIEREDGSQVITPDTPKYDEDSGMYETERDGRKVQINKDDVKSIEEVK
ncbi:YgdI/YgdR family lipoprotein [Bordetella trematum]|uniref:YgdI/YgdR family lipoprotein n=1 Tax=Bordetella trematum TaxID=123899 RepID=UPI000D83D341|nr:YgdI/YgdR family lipoprotein [Bordetella trematum]SPU50408.1 lipoprotein [Bordetella trematum]VDH06649.1 Uncharacterized lipoprotein ygdR precursor [Bordetella trematum]